jgi:anhydro-N-acetylmuramic acid kinase
VSPTKSSEIFIGLMSGTSLDGIDVAIVDFAEFPPRPLYCATTPYTESIRQRLQQLCHSPTTSLDNLYSLDAELGELYAQSVNSALHNASIDHSQVSALGSHGQTIRHSPDSTYPFSAQIGDPNRLAALTGVTTVADFRRKDIALGGQGAPLAPAFHRFLFQSTAESRALINIGGIANLTYLPADSKQRVIGFDTGPGNTLLDHWNQKHRGSGFDESGAWARAGRVIESLLQNMLSDDGYFRLAPPKSTGTEHFNPDWLTHFLKHEYDPTDVQTTLTELTAITIARAIATLPTVPEKCFICGGGAHNQYLLERLAFALPECAVATTSALGLDPDYVEAVAFAWLARERINLRSGNIPEVTRASQATILGGIYSAN